MKMFRTNWRNYVWAWSFTVFFFCSMISQAIARQKDLKEATVYMTARSTQQLLANRGNRAFETLDQPDENYPTIMIDIDKTFQIIEGFGGAFTDASAIVFAKLPKNKQQEFLKACFDPD